MQGRLDSGLKGRHVHGWFDGDPEVSVSCFWCQLLTCASSTSQSDRRFLREHLTASQREQGPVAGPSSIDPAIFEPSWEFSYSLYFQGCYTAFFSLFLSLFLILVLSQKLIFFFKLCHKEVIFKK